MKVAKAKIAILTFLFQNEGLFSTCIKWELLPGLNNEYATRRRTR